MKRFLRKKSNSSCFPAILREPDSLLDVWSEKKYRISSAIVRPRRNKVSPDDEGDYVQGWILSFRGSSRIQIPTGWRSNDVCTEINPRCRDLCKVILEVTPTLLGSQVNEDRNCAQPGLASLGEVAGEAGRKKKKRGNKSIPSASAVT